MTARNPKELQHKIQQTSGATTLLSTLREVEINLIDACNRVCSFCPHSQDNYQYRNGRADLDLFKVIGDQLLAQNYTGIITLCGFGEPTMYKQLADAVKILSKIGVGIELVTNGEILTKKKLDNLFTQGLTYISISVYEEKYLAHAESLIKNLTDDQWLIRHRYRNEIEIVNRNEMIVNTSTITRTSPCWLPTYKMLINHTGDVMLCCNDWTRSNTYGNVFSDNLWDIWLNTLADKRKELLSATNITGVCSGCDIYGKVYGNNSAEVFIKEYNL